MSLKDKKLTEKAFAKLNLFLEITGALENGYHSLETLMQTVDLFDEVTVELEGDKTIVSCDNPQIPSDERNIAYKAAELFKKELGKNFGIKIHIKKKIPVEAGLGGSSTDGAAVLRALNKLFGSPFSNEKLRAMSSSLGADVAFCLCGGTRLCLGIGDIMEKTAKLGDCGFVIVKPDFSKNTAEAYRLYDEKKTSRCKTSEKMRAALSENSVQGVADELYNVFTELYDDERIENIKKELILQGALGAEMTGSGSAVFGIFSNIKKAESAMEKLPFELKYAVKPVNALEICK